MRTSHNTYTVYKQSDPLNSLTNTIRLRYGLHWLKSYPSGEEFRETLRYAFYLALIFLAYGIVGRMDYEDQLITEKIAADRDRDILQERMLACLNGGSTGYYTADANGHKHYIVCDQPFTVSTENVRGAR